LSGINRLSVVSGSDVFPIVSATVHSNPRGSGVVGLSQARAMSVRKIDKCFHMSKSPSSRMSISDDGAIDDKI
jgi:hypothetical protein